MRIIHAKFQPSGAKGVGGERGDGRGMSSFSHHFPANAMRISTSSLASQGRDKNELSMCVCVCLVSLVMKLKILSISVKYVLAIKRGPLRTIFVSTFCQFVV